MSVWFVTGASRGFGAEIVDRAPAAPRLDHPRPGDPAKAAPLSWRSAGARRPPLRVQLGRDAFERAGRTLEFVAGEQPAWRDLSLSTDHDDVAAH